MDKTSTTPMKDVCGVCNKPFLMLWENEEQTRGRSEKQIHVAVQVCSVEYREEYISGYEAHEWCYEKLTGIRPRSLYELNEQRKREHKNNKAK